MVDKYAGPFGTYTSVQVISAAAQTEVMLNIQSLATLFGGTIAAGVVTAELGTASVPDFNKIPPAIRSRILKELAALSAATDAAPAA